MVPERFSVRGKKNPKPKQDTKDLSKSPLWTHTHTSDLVLPRSHPPVPPGISTVVLPRKSLFLIKPGHHGHCAQRPGPSLPSTCPKEEGPIPVPPPGAPSLLRLWVPGWFRRSDHPTFLSAPFPTRHPSLPPLKSWDLAWERCLWAFHKSSIPLNQNQLAWPKVLPLRDCPFFSNPRGLNCSKEPGCE